MQKEKIYEIDLTWDELEILRIALQSSDHLEHDICYDCMIERRSDYVKRLEVAGKLREKISQIIDINTL